MGWLVKYLPKQNMVWTDVLKHGAHILCSVYFFKSFMLVKVIQQKVEDKLEFLCSWNMYDFLKPTTQRIFNMCSPIVMPAQLLPQKFECNSKYRIRIMPISRILGNTFLSEIDMLFCSLWIFCHFTLNAHHSLFRQKLCTYSFVTRQHYVEA